MLMKDRVVILSEDNIKGLKSLYGEIHSVDELSKIINNHIIVAIDEIKEDLNVE